MEFDYHKTKMH